MKVSSRRTAGDVDLFHRHHGDEKKMRVRWIESTTIVVTIMIIIIYGI